MAQGVKGSTPIRRCADCGVVVSLRAQRCNKCYGKTKRVRPIIKACLDCDKQLSRWAHRAGSKRCRKCAPNEPARRAKRSRDMAQLYVRRPELREQTRAMMQGINASGKAGRHLGTNKWRHEVRKTRIGSWCPEEYWDFYFRLRRRKVSTGRRRRSGTVVYRNLTAAECRAIIEGHIGGPLRPVSMTYPQLLRNECTRGGETVKLRPEVARLLSILLMQDPERYFNQTALIERMWPDPDLEPDSAMKMIDLYVMGLRRAGIRVVRSANYGRGFRIPVEARARGQTVDLATAARRRIIAASPGEELECAHSS